MKKRVLSIAVVLILIFALFPANALASSEIIVFPDPNFKAAVLASMRKRPTDEITKAEAASVLSLSVNWKDISDLSGIEHFTSLQYLGCNYNQLTTLDVSNNPALERLDCRSNQLTALDVSNNPALERLECAYNQLATLDVSNKPALERIVCYNNQLTTLDVSNNPALEFLDCKSNQLTTLDVSGLYALRVLDCRLNNMTDGSKVIGVSDTLLPTIDTVEPRNAYTFSPQNDSAFPIANREDFAINRGVLVEYSGAGGHVVIPDGVIGIGENAFSGCTSLTSVTIPNSVTSIGDFAFPGCTNLTSVTIPNSVTSIGYGAFGGCTSLTSVTIPGSVTSISDVAFRDCTSLTSVTIQNGVTSIGYCTFWRCTSLTSVTIPDSVTSIGEGAFSGCESLSSVTMQYGVNSIGERAFSGCTNLTSVTIPDSVMSIGSSAFSGCTNLTSIVIPDSVTSIGSFAFMDCTSLISIMLGNSVTSIGNSAFFSCTSLTSVTIPNGVTSIGTSTFSNCRSLTSIMIPESVTSISNDAFFDCGHPVVYGIAGSYAETYANNRNIPFVATSDTTPTDTAPMSRFAAVNSYAIGQFPDVDENQWYGANVQNVIARAYEYGLMKGNNDGSFNPMGNVTIAEAITIAARVHNIYNGGSGEFAQGEPWYQGYVDYAIVNGIIQVGNFTDYDKTATRAEMAYIFSRSLPETEFAEQNIVNSLPDVNSSTPYSDAIILLYKAGVVTGDTGTFAFRPGDTVSRAEAAAIISRVILPGMRTTGRVY